MNTDPKIIKSHYVYQYTFLDDLSFIASPEKYFANQFFETRDKDKIQVAVEAVKKRFLKAGWEGDGKIGVIWIPPFVDIGIEDTWGNYFWHVKQRNNGVSFIMSPFPLTFKRIKDQNDEDEMRGTPKSIVDSEVEVHKREFVEILAELQGKLATIADISDKTAGSALREDILLHGQGRLVSSLFEFLDSCYLQVLITAINGQTAGIKLRKSRVHLEPHDYVPDDSPGEDANTWFTLQGVISDMWNAYKFEPFKSKMEMLFGSVEFKVNNDLLMFIKKHVAMRNCVQHHGGYAALEVLREAGLQSFKIRTEKGQIKIEKGNKIVLSWEELTEFGEKFRELMDRFNKHVWVRVPARYFLVNKNAKKSEPEYEE